MESKKTYPRFIFQQKFIKIQPWQLKAQSKLEKPKRKVLMSASSTSVEVKLEHGEKSAVPNELEEVIIDGSDLLDPDKPNQDFVIYMCKPCKIYFSRKHMFELHNRTVHPSEPPYIGYRKAKSGQYICNYCDYHAFSPVPMTTHVSRRHSQELMSDADMTSRDAIEAEKPQKIEELGLLVEDDEDSWPMEVIEDLEVEATEEEKVDAEASTSSGRNRPRKCLFCPFETEKSSTFYSHLKRKHSESWLKTVSEKMAALQKPNLNEISCTQCSFKSFKHSSMRSHVARKHGTAGAESVKSAEDESRDEDSNDAIAEYLNLTPQRNLPCDEDEAGASEQPHEKKKCRFCPYECSLLGTMRSHVARRHPRQLATDRDETAANSQAYTGYACHFCDFVASTVASFKAHTARQHSVEKQPLMEVPVNEYDCDQCEFKTKDRRNMQLHVRKCHKVVANAEGMYACHACTYETLSRMGLQRHISIKHNKPRREAAAASRRTCYKCEYCEFRCLNRKTMEWHTRQHSAPCNAEESTNYFCNDCDFSTWTKGQLELHMKRKHRDLDSGAAKVKEAKAEVQEIFYACEQCDYTSKNKHVMKVHVIRKHTNDYNHECEQCGKKYKVKADLTNHIRFQHREQPIICDVCGKTCRNSNLLYLHQKFAHYKPEFECLICHRRMVSQANLDDHILKQHEQRENAICEECGKTFSKQARLKIHMRVHSGIKPYSCKICQKSFARRNGLRQHLLIHTGQRPYVCDICSKSFTQKTGLISHRKSHPGMHPPLPRVTIDHVLSELLADES